ncbi:MAB_1171c family putative transporter [Actinomadura hibisca]|uniref:MAB_1171c family putative transporter n=1 Tax=Actinomadura hibisca TaxID=68565 RepID=UPI000832E789|nr:MAB_1171c family putative transporter [Actinomadura hibisca]
MLVVAALWLAIIWRLPSAIRHPGRLRLWFVYASQAIALTSGFPPVMDAMSRWQGLPGPAHLVKYLLGIIACWASLNWLAGTDFPVRSRWLAHRHLATLAFGVLLTAIFVAIETTPKTEFALRAAESPLVVAYLLIFDGCLALTLVVGAAIYRSSARMASDACVRAGLWLLYVHNILGTIYALTDSGVLTVDFLSRNSDTTPAWAYPTIALFSNSAVLLALVGLAIPPAGQTVARLRDRYRLIALRPIWHRLTSHAPEVVHLGRPRLRDDLTRPDLKMGLLRRTLELHDARLLLRSRLSPQELQTITDSLQASGLEDAELASAVDAATLRVGIAALAQGRNHDQQLLAPAAGGQDLHSDVRLFLAIRRADRSPAVAEAARRLLQKDS